MGRIKLESGRRPERRYRLRRWFIAFAIIAAFVVVVKGFTLLTGRTNPLDRALTILTTPVVRVITRIGEGLVSLSDVPSALRENRRLYAENQLLKRRMAELQQLESENQRLTKLLKLKVPEGFTPVTATVVARPYDLWLESAILDAGRQDGLVIGNLVVNEDGVVGVLNQVEATYSRIQLISSPEFRLGATTERGRDQGVIRGVDARTLAFDYLPAGSKIDLGEKVYTRGEESYPGGQQNRPKGIFIGTVAERVEDESGFLRVTVEPAANPNRLGAVVVFTR